MVESVRRFLEWLGQAGTTATSDATYGQLDQSMCHRLGSQLTANAAAQQQWTMTTTSTDASNGQWYSYWAPGGVLHMPTSGNYGPFSGGISSRASPGPRGHRITLRDGSSHPLLPVTEIESFGENRSVLEGMGREDEPDNDPDTFGLGALAGPNTNRIPNTYWESAHPEWVGVGMVPAGAKTVESGGKRYTYEGRDKATGIRVFREAPAGPPQAQHPEGVPTEP